ncbi:mitochondrial glutamyl-tRNA amidotransferase alpha subunit Gta1 [Schizosaccharomyces pombe]|uniref:Glutamyl-tRNA(Gln) amidotransferase subunit A, mitochondrial n=1 Tax=Schizosaccharomyces pombe (strain 972 / ATCC 24843) TaxID=284812 RepID=GATA_SCHPO|nr:putative glutamyl-tRNA amidotransferase alpha subunit [Schizosaccharomyces pombe]O94509.1 RecName: Full=Glutamyl-tRNA(Gln) amidotransferase subunit A, mitochondrial; Short=Glu-AdT subunit A [Schizosaccharomyces pombe 972h-]CAA22807.1 mitochondrial glutamyl-tRNA amidotransferase alpha subunit (predicted) [Schizosaccharomyces pombe]|eukprot:NP_595361.1 putative glutamyl-tRNA amidotransferase alpha subunit [Schizosaccharomyces pombe]
MSNKYNNLLKEVAAKYASIILNDAKIKSLTSINSAEYLYDSFVEISKLPLEKKLPLKWKLITVKENICTKTNLTTAASNMLKDYNSPFDASIVESLKKAGGIILGKTNMDEFAMGVKSENNLFGRTVNPVVKDSNYDVGGSSGGAAAAIAADICYASVGSDTGGSIRLPAAYVGCVGFKPSFGRISRYGMLAFANSFDTVGIAANNVKGVTKVFNVLDHPDINDSTCLTKEARYFVKEQHKKLSRKPIKIGIPIDWNVSETHPNVLDKWNEFISLLKSNGYLVQEIQLPISLYANSVYSTMAYAEATSNLAKYNTIAFGNCLDEKFEEEIISSTARSFFLGDEVKKRLLLGAYSLARMNSSDLFSKARYVRRAIQLEFNKNFFLPSFSVDDPRGDIDFIVTPSFFNSSQPIETPSSYSHLSDTMLVPANMAGIPSVSIPFGTLNNGLPMGIQIMAQYLNDEDLLSFAGQFA